MNRTLLNHLQRMRDYPSVTILMNTDPGTTFGDGDQTRARRLASTARQRLDTLIDDEPTPLLDAIDNLIAERVGQRSAHALAIFVSSEHQEALLLGGPVEERVVIDETFATRDLVADLNRTVAFRVVTVSDSTARMLSGDRQRLVEERSDDWPLTRADEMSDTIWRQTVTDAATEMYAAHPVPTITAGVNRSSNRHLDATRIDVIGHVSGNHDRTSPGELHTLAWPIVLDWKAQRQTRAFEELENARSAKRYAAGVDEIWPLAQDGRVEHLVVEHDYSYTARLDDDGHLHPTHDLDRGVIDDAVDELIEAVLQNGGRITSVETATLERCGRIAAVLRF